MAHDVFISYSNKDKPTADAVCATLETHGIRCWIAPRDIRSGSDWGEAIIDAISASRAVVLVFSSNANAAQEFIKREVERAVSKSIPIVPFRIEDVVPARSLEFFLGSVHWLDALTPPLEAHLARLTETVAAIVDADAAGGRRDDDRRHRESDDGTRRRSSGTGSSRTRVAIAAAIGALVLAALAFLWLRAPERMETGTPSVNDARLTGTWQTRVVTNGIPFQVVFSVAPDGTFTTTSTTEDAGTIDVRGGRWSMTSDATRQHTDGTYRMLSADRMTMTGPLGTTEWSRGGPAVHGAQDHELTATWQSRFARDGLDWKGQLDLPPSGRAAARYRVRFSTEESGSISASKGAWRTTSSQRGVTEGSYQIADADTLSMTGPPGTIVWRRVGGTP